MTDIEMKMSLDRFCVYVNFLKIRYICLWYTCHKKCNSRWKKETDYDTSLNVHEGIWNIPPGNLRVTIDCHWQTFEKGIKFYSPVYN